jgi:AmmeMemoRadiSam system protein A
MREAPRPISEEGRRDLLTIARRTLEAHFRGEPAPRLASDRAETFGEARGLFVTLRKNGELRGCIGTLAPHGDLSHGISEYALRAALEDPRFAPLSSEELPICAIEISVLTPPEPISGPEEIEVGLDGLIFENRGRRGLLLPQVATEWGFDAERFVSEVARKAGLPPESWREPGARLWAFRAEVFGE